MTSIDQLAEAFIAESVNADALSKHHDRPEFYVELAWAIKEICYRAWHSEPSHAQRAAAALARLTVCTDDLEINALSAWTAGVAAIASGELVMAVNHLDAAAMQFEQIGKHQHGAQTQVVKVAALSMLGRYQEAEQCGLTARDFFLTTDDLLAAGKIEYHLGNLYFRRDDYEQATNLYRAASAHFAEAGDIEHSIMAEKGLADTLAWQQDFSGASDLYQRVIIRAVANALPIVVATTKHNFGLLELARAEYQDALHMLGEARREFEALKLPQMLAVAEQGLADVYLELNLLPEALSRYENAIALFSQQGLHADEAWAQSQYGRALAQSERLPEARIAFTHAQNLFASEGNTIGAAMSSLWQAELALAGTEALQDANEALVLIAHAENLLASVGSTGQREMARWLRAEALRRAGKGNDAHRLLFGVVESTKQNALPQIEIRAHTTLGLIAHTSGDLAGAESSYERAIRLIESRRSDLPGEELRGSYLQSQQRPYVERLRLALDDEGITGAAKVLRAMERVRSRALLDVMVDNEAPARRIDALPEAVPLTELRKYRASLNWCYRRMLSGSEDTDSMASLQKRIEHLEKLSVEAARRVEHDALAESVNAAGNGELDVDQLTAALGNDSALVEYFCLDDEILACVVTGDGRFVFRRMADQQSVTDAVRQLRFQTDTLRHGVERMRAHLPELAARARAHLGKLYSALIAPIENVIGERRLVVVPHRVLHYVPFEALFDGKHYLIEKREVCRVPSAAVLLKCLARKSSAIDHAVIAGIGGAALPHVAAELTAVSSLFGSSTLLRDQAATLDAIAQHASAANVLHLACHGWFRPDSPFLSSLHLADGVLTVRDAYRLPLNNCSLVTLSACETGISVVAPGDELIGLARGFFSAGVPSVVASLWTVDDGATAEFMRCFYQKLVAGNAPAAALRVAQLRTLAHHAHPYFWSAFVLHGRW